MRLKVRWVVLLVLVLVVIVPLAVVARDFVVVERDARAARSAVASGRIRAARPPLLRWLRARPRSAEAHAVLAELELAEGDFAAVKRAFNEARALGLPEAQLDRLRGIWLARLGRYDEAEALLLRLTSAEGKSDPAIEEALARIYLKTYRLRQASAVLQRWINDAPADGRPFLWLTEIDRRTEVDNPEAWVRHYREALARDPDLDTARHGLAESLRHLHRNEEAAQEFERYLARHPDDPVALSGAGLNALERGNPAAAARLLDRALALRPNQSAALKARAELDLHHGDLSSARRRLDTAVEAEPFDDEARHVRARVRKLLGDTAGAQADLDAFNRLKKDQAELLKMRERLVNNPSDNDTRYKTAAWCFAHGRSQDGLEWAMAVLANDPDHASTCLLLADYYSKQPEGAGLANFYRVKAATHAAAGK
jgi:Tfp pilus assembly protein PilF